MYSYLLSSLDLAGDIDLTHGKRRVFVGGSRCDQLSADHVTSNYRVE